MARREQGKSVVKRARKAIARTAKKLTTKLSPRRRRKTAEPVEARATTRATPKVKTARAVRPAKRRSDIPLDMLAQTYTPTQTSLKAPFRTTGADRQRDQEFVADRPDAPWNDEDHFTNKSGDPRIGTHGRAYEPGEKK